MARGSTKPGDQTRQAIMAFVESFIEENGYSPTVKEIEQAVQRSDGSVHYQLDLLVEGGFLSRKEKAARTLRVMRAFSERSVSGENHGRL